MNYLSRRRSFGVRSTPAFSIATAMPCLPFGYFQLQFLKPLQCGFQPFDFQVKGVSAIFQELILFEQKHDGDATSGRHLVPVFFTDSDLVERLCYVEYEMAVSFAMFATP